MVSDAMANASSLPAFAKDSSGKKKKTSRFAKLKQSKLDVRREQWLSQAKSKNDKVDSDVMVESPLPSSGEANKKHRAPENLQRKPKEEDHDALSTHDTESESLMSSSFGSSLGHDLLGKHSFGGSSSSSSSSSGYCSGSVSEEERDDGCLDDWEAIADALTLEDKQEQHPKPEDVVSNELNPANNNNNKKGTPKDASAEIQHSKTNKCAWKPNDTSRPQSLPNPSKQHNTTSQPANPMFNGGSVWSWRSIASSQPSPCPICCEDLDMTDSSFLPCPCGFRLCLFCHKRILEEDSRCPGCRRQYETAHNDAAKCQATFASIMKLRA